MVESLRRLMRLLGSGRRDGQGRVAMEGHISFVSCCDVYRVIRCTEAGSEAREKGREVADFGWFPVLQLSR